MVKGKVWIRVCRNMADASHSLVALDTACSLFHSATHALAYKDRRFAYVMYTCYVIRFPKQRRRCDVQCRCCR